MSNGDNTSKADGRMQAGENLRNGNLVNDLETMRKALYIDKKLTRLGESKSARESSKKKSKDAKDNANDSFGKDKRLSIFRRGLKALTLVGSRRFNCCFSLLVHSIEGLPDLFDGASLVVHWKREDGEQMTCPIRVYQGIAEFEEQLTHSCSVYGSRKGSRKSAKYEAEHFLLYVSVHDFPELELGKHRVDMTRLFPLTLDELKGEKSSGKWTTTFKLSGKAKGAIMIVTFGYSVTGNNTIESSTCNDSNEILSLQPSSAKARKISDQFDPMDELGIAGSLPARLSILNHSAEDIKDLHEVLPNMPRSEQRDSVSVFDQKLDEVMFNASVKNKLDFDPIPFHVDPHELEPFRPTDGGEKIFETEWEISEFSVIEKEIEQVKFEENPTKLAQASGKVLGNEDVALHFSDKEIVSDKNELSMGSYNSNEKEDDDMCFKENISEKNELSISTCNSKERVDDNMCSKEKVIKEENVSENDELSINTRNSKEKEDDGMCFKEILIKEKISDKKKLSISTFNSIEKEDDGICSKEMVIEEEIYSDKKKLSVSTCNSKEKEDGDICSKEMVIKEENVSDKNKLSISTCNSKEKKDDGICSKEMLIEDEIIPQKNDLPIISTCNSKEKEGNMCSNEIEDEIFSDRKDLSKNYEDKEDDVGSTETLIKELEISYASDLVNDGLVSLKDKTDALYQENFLDINSNYRDYRKGKTLSLDDITDLVASDFLNMLDIEHSPSNLSSESVPEFPREHLLMQFEKDGLLDFGVIVDPTELFSDIPMDSVSRTVSGDFLHSSMCEEIREMPEIKKDALRTKLRASKLEDLETESLMRDWGLNEMVFEHSRSHSPSTSEDLQQLPSLAEGLGPFAQTKNGGLLRTMNPALFRNAENGGNLIMQVSCPVVVPAEMGSGVMEILEGLASVGIEKLSMQANRLMPLEDITENTIQQMALEAAISSSGPQRQGLLQHETEIMQTVSSNCMGVGRLSSGPKSDKLDSASGTEYVSLEDLAPLAMDKIEALSIEGLRIQSSMSDENAPLNISTHIGGFSPLTGKTHDGSVGLKLLDINNGEDVDDGLMSLSLTLEEWMKLDSGEIDENDLVSCRTSKILAAHHATSLELFREKSKHGLLGNNFTVAFMVQLRDPSRNYEPVGTPMLALIQVERAFFPPKQQIYTVPPATNEEEEEEETNIIEKPKEEKINEKEVIPLYKITEVHVAGLKTGRKKLWGSIKQQHAGSRWLVANGMGKKNKHPLMKSKAVARSSSSHASCSSSSSSTETTRVQPGDTLWSISSRVHGTGAKWKELAALNPHIRNPNFIFPNETIRLR